jgi:hypothetical protein
MSAESTHDKEAVVFDRNWSDLNKTRFILYGSGFSLTAMAIFFPFELAKTRMQYTVHTTNIYYITIG